MNPTAQQSSVRSERSRVGQGWALASCLALVLLSAMSVALSVVITQVVLTNRVSVMLGIVVWFQMMSWPVTLLGLAAASLRRLALSIVAIVVGLAHGAALLVLLALIVADLSVTASVMSAGTVGLTVVAVALTTVGPVLALFRPKRALPVSAVVGIVAAAAGTVLSVVAEAIAGPVLQGISEAGPVSPLSFLAPAAVMLIGLAVHGRRWYLAGIATVLLAIGLVVPALGLVRHGALILADELGGWFILQPVMATVRMLLAAAATAGLTTALLRSSSKTP